MQEAIEEDGAVGGEEAVEVEAVIQVQEAVEWELTTKETGVAVDRQAAVSKEYWWRQGKCGDGGRSCVSVS